VMGWGIFVILLLLLIGLYIMKFRMMKTNNV
jgi:hypothetical protein